MQSIQCRAVRLTWESPQMFLGNIDHRWRGVNHLVRILSEQSLETGDERADPCRFEEST